MNPRAVSRPRRAALSSGARAAFFLAALAAPCGAATGAATGAAGEDAATDLADLSLEELLDIEVTSVSRREQKLSDAAAAVFVLTSEDIRRSGATSIPEALRLVPGLQVASIDANKWAISSRGFNLRFANKMLVLLDGRSAYTPLFSGVYWDVQDTLLEDIERIEVIRGPGATLWGANAVNGVINIRTRRASDTHGTLLVGGGGTEERLFVGARHGGAAGKDAAYRIYAKAFTRDDASLATDGRAADGWRGARGGFRVDWELDPGQSLTAQGDFYRTEAGGTGTAVESPVPPLVTRFDEKADLTGGHLLLRWSHELGSDSDFSLQGYYDRSDRDSRIHGERRDTLDVDFQHRLRRGRHQVVWGAGYRYSHDDIRSTFSIAFDPEERGDKLISAFAQDEISLAGGKLLLTLGSKFEHNDYTGFEVQPSARMLVHLPDAGTLWAAVSRAVRTPSRADHDLRAVLGPAQVPGGPPSLPALVTLYGDRGLVAEELIAYEAGWRLQPTSRLSLDIAAFYNDYDRLRSIEPLPVGLVAGPAPYLEVPLRFGNGLKGRTYGGEVALQWSVSSRLRLIGSYALLDVDLEPESDSLDATSEQAEGDSPHHQILLRSLADLGHGFELDATLHAVDELPNQGIGGYLRLDTRLGWRPRRGIQLNLVLQNLLDGQHPEFGSVLGEVPTQTERAVYFKVGFRF